MRKLFSQNQMKQNSSKNSALAHDEMQTTLFCFFLMNFCVVRYKRLVQKVSRKIFGLIYHYSHEIKKNIFVRTNKLIVAIMISKHEELAEKIVGKYKNRRMNIITYRTSNKNLEKSTRGHNFQDRLRKANTETIDFINSWDLLPSFKGS